jgi:hypothetical protein
MADVIAFNFQYKPTEEQLTQLKNWIKALQTTELKQITSNLSIVDVHTFKPISACCLGVLSLL